MRAWRGLDRFEGRSAVRSWLYRIATNVCFDMLKGGQRRARPMDLGPARSADRPVGSTAAGGTWVEPIPDGRVAADRRRPGRRGRGPRLRPAGVRGRPAAPAAAPAGRPDPARGAAAGGPARSPSCSTRRSRRSTAPCSGPGRRSRPREPRHRRAEAAGRPSSGRCSTATSMRSSATTWTRSPRCCTRTRPSPCRHSTCGCAGRRGHPAVVARSGRRLPRVPAGAHRRERLARVRPVQAERTRRSAPAVGAAGPARSPATASSSSRSSCPPTRCSPCSGCRSSPKPAPPRLGDRAGPAGGPEPCEGAPWPAEHLTAGGR